MTVFRDLRTLLVVGNSEEGLQTATYLNLITLQAIQFKAATALLCLRATEFENCAANLHDAGSSHRATG